MHIVYVVVILLKNFNLPLLGMKPIDFSDFDNSLEDLRISILLKLK